MSAFTLDQLKHRFPSPVNNQAFSCPAFLSSGRPYSPANFLFVITNLVSISSKLVVRYTVTIL